MTKTEFEQLLMEAINKNYSTFNLLATYVEEKLNISRFKQTKFRKFLKIVLLKFIGLKTKFVIIENDNNEEVEKVYYLSFDTIDELSFFKDDYYHDARMDFVYLSKEEQEYISRTLVSTCLKYSNYDKTLEFFEKVLNLKSQNKKIYRLIQYVNDCLKKYYVNNVCIYNTIDLPREWVQSELNSFISKNDISSFDYSHPMKNPLIKPNFSNVNI